MPRLDLWLWFWMLCWLYLGIILVNLRKISYINLYYDYIFNYYVYLILFCYFEYFFIINRYLRIYKKPRPFRYLFVADRILKA